MIHFEYIFEWDIRLRDSSVVPFSLLSSLPAFSLLKKFSLKSIFIWRVKWLGGREEIFPTPVHSADEQDSLNGAKPSQKQDPGIPSVALQGVHSPWSGSEARAGGLTQNFCWEAGIPSGGITHCTAFPFGLGLSNCSSEDCLHSVKLILYFYKENQLDVFFFFLVGCFWILYSLLPIALSYLLICLILKAGILIFPIVLSFIVVVIPVPLLCHMHFRMFCAPKLVG